jgi:hypothetical protein
LFLVIGRVLGFAIGVCLFAATLRAQERPVVVFGSLGGVGLGHADSAQGNAPLFGGGVGFQLTSRLVLEGDVHSARVGHVFGRDHHDFTETTLTGSLLFQSTPHGRAHFIAGGGAGLQWAHTDVDDPPVRIDRTERIRLLHGRIGAEWDISNRMAVRTEGVMWFGAGLDWILGARAGLCYRF